VNRKQEAREFASRAKPDRAYYYVTEYAPGSRGPKRLLNEIVFKKPKRLYGPYPLWYGPKTAYDAYMQNGPLYEDRSHPAIRGMQTAREHTEEVEKFADAFLGGDNKEGREFANRLDRVADGTNFRRNRRTF
jgi:hypothetical protein